MLLLRQAWDMGCFATVLQCLHLDSKIQRDYTGLKITVCMCSWGKLWTKRYKKTKEPNWYFWRVGRRNRVLGAKAGYCACLLHSTPPKRWVDHLSHPSSRPLNTSLPSPYIRNQLSPPRGVSEQGKLLLCSLPAVSAGTPVRPCLNFLSGL